MGENENLIKDCIRYDGVDLDGENVIIKFLMVQYQGDDSSSIILRELKKMIENIA